jgi:cell division septum initiation protein DivIVA
MAGFNAGQLKDELKRLFAAAGYEKEELLRLVDDYETLAAEYAALLAENERLKTDAKRHAARNADSHYMSSRLWDAIHE